MDKKEIETEDNNNIENKELVQNDLINDVIGNVLKEKKGGKREKFFLYWILGLPTNTCGKLAGYTESYSYKLVSQYNKQPKLRHTIDKFLNVMPERYQSICKLRLAEIAEIEGAAIQEYRKDPKLLIDKPQLAKSIKQSAGVLGEEHPQAQTINVGSINVLMQNMHKMAEKEFGESEVIEGEIEG